MCSLGLAYDDREPLIAVQISSTLAACLAVLRSNYSTVELSEIAWDASGCTGATWAVFDRVRRFQSTRSSALFPRQPTSN